MVKASQTPLAKYTLFIKDTTLGKLINDKQNQYAKYYVFAKNAFWINLCLLLVFFSGLLYVHRKRKHQVIYSVMIKSAISLVVLAVISLLFFSKNPSNVFLRQNEFGRDVVLPVSYAFVSKFAFIQFTLAGIYLLVALGAWIWFRKFKTGVAGPK